MVSYFVLCRLVCVLEVDKRMNTKIKTIGKERKRLQGERGTQTDWRCKERKIEN